ncbi:hypothetical protein [Lyngbya confervoides]|uniref:C-type lectin domain-containing protein n=1 Tax=Lyngbya confervoides BDU141951 TaxID=1574623 RepID=A0ABD4T921_9CYAN|nr:hypothetical protein [Lyngbya confervoides]MCM1985131.1 hypothetical protein [Lyngbya confervoides BDU141951]
MSLPTAYSVQPLASEATADLNPEGYPVCRITYNRDAWVKMLQPPNEYSAEDAKLLCQESENTWVAWVPDHGEIILDRSNIYC